MIDLEILMKGEARQPGPDILLLQEVAWTKTKQSQPTWAKLVVDSNFPDLAILYNPNIQLERLAQGGEFTQLARAALDPPVILVNVHALHTDVFAAREVAADIAHVVDTYGETHLIVVAGDFNVNLPHPRLHDHACHAILDKVLTHNQFRFESATGKSQHTHVEKRTKWAPPSLIDFILIRGPKSIQVKSHSASWENWIGSPFRPPL